MDVRGDIYVVLPQQKHSHTVILLHGRDSNASEFAGEFLESQASDGRILPEVFPTIKWVFPTSKLRNSARL
jgi:lysophospholipase II